MTGAVQPPVTKTWPTAAVLACLVEHAINAAGHQFTAGQLDAWLAQGKSLTLQQRINATTRLCGLGFVQHQVTTQDNGGTLDRVDLYTLTAAGAEAVRSAAAGYVRKSGPKGSRAPNPVRATDLASRLWYVLRMRKQIDANAAALLLCDAAADDFDRARATIACTLRRWEVAGALAPAARRVHGAGDSKHSNGFKRYVLVQDSPQPPRWTAAAKAAKAAKARQATQEAPQ